MSTVALITNDDGVDAPGIRVLARAASEAGLEAMVAAPSWDSSGAAASLTAVEEHGRLVAERRSFDGLDDLAVWGVEAAPAYIVRAAMAGAFGQVPDVVLSGVNLGANTGTSVLHSGTVGAVMTGATLGRPGLAASLGIVDGSAPEWGAVASVLADVIPRFLELGSGILNLNVPSVAVGDLKGVEVATLAPVGSVRTTVTERGGGYVRLAYEPEVADAPDGSDVALLEDGWATLTALRPLCEAEPGPIAEFARRP